MKMNKVLTGLLISLILWITWSYIWITHNSNEEKLACEELGFENYKYTEDMEYCEDIENNLHYVKMDCKPWYWYNCIAKPISVGDVRIK